MSSAPRLSAGTPLWQPLIPSLAAPLGQPVFRVPRAVCPPCSQVHHQAAVTAALSVCAPKPAGAGTGAEPAGCCANKHTLCRLASRAARLPCWQHVQPCSSVGACMGCVSRQDTCHTLCLCVSCCCMVEVRHAAYVSRVLCCGIACVQVCMRQGRLCEPSHGSCVLCAAVGAFQRPHTNGKQSGQQCCWAGTPSVWPAVCMCTAPGPGRCTAGLQSCGQWCWLESTR